MHETLICELSKVKQGVWKKKKDYHDRVQVLSIRIVQSLITQEHTLENPIFKGIKALIVKHFMIKLILELLQQVKYEGVNTLEDVIHVAEKKDASLEFISMTLPQDIAKTDVTLVWASSSMILL